MKKILFPLVLLVFLVNSHADNQEKRRKEDSVKVDFPAYNLTVTVDSIALKYRNYLFLAIQSPGKLIKVDKFSVNNNKGWPPAWEKVTTKKLLYDSKNAHIDMIEESMVPRSNIIIAISLIFSLLLSVYSLIRGEEKSLLLSLPCYLVAIFCGFILKYTVTALTIYFTVFISLISTACHNPDIKNYSNVVDYQRDKNIYKFSTAMQIAGHIGAIIALYFAW